MEFVCYRGVVHSLLIHFPMKLERYEFADVVNPLPLNSLKMYWLSLKHVLPQELMIIFAHNASLSNQSTVVEPSSTVHFYVKTLYLLMVYA